MASTETLPATSSNSAPPADQAPTSLDPNAGLTLDTPDTPVTTPAAAPTKAAVSEPWSKGWVKEDGTFDHTKFEKAPDDLKGLAKEIARFKSPDDFLKSHISLREMASKKGIAEPLAKDATPEQRAQHMDLVRRALGAPDKVEGYKVTKPDAVPAENWNQAAVDAAAKIAFEEGVSPAALNKLAEMQVKLGMDAQAAQVAAQQKADKEWFDGQDKLIREVAAKESLDYSKAKDLADKAGRRFGIDPTNPAMKNASVFSAMMRIGKLLGEDNLVQGKTETLADLAALTPSTALAKADSIRKDPANPKYEAFWQKKGPHPDHDAVVAEVAKLSEIAHKNYVRKLF
jgi:hypothetical protein